MHVRGLLRCQYFLVFLQIAELERAQKCYKYECFKWLEQQTINQKKKGKKRAATTSKTTKGMRANRERCLFASGLVTAQIYIYVRFFFCVIFIIENWYAKLCVAKETLARDQS